MCQYAKNFRTDFKLWFKHFGEFFKCQIWTCLCNSSGEAIWGDRPPSSWQFESPRRQRASYHFWSQESLYIFCL